MSNRGILLESGTNELEIVEFHVNRRGENGEIQQAFYGVNVAKVKEIIRSPGFLSEVPKAHPALLGVLSLRGKIVPVISLPKWLGKEQHDEPCTRVIIMEFNRIITGFSVHSVSRIHRVSWEKVESPKGVISSPEEECVTGIVKFEDRILMMIDFEKIVAEINPEMGASDVKVTKASKRESKTVFLAEDSSFINKMIVDLLTTAGYRVFTSFNGQDALLRIMNVVADAKSNKRPISNYLNLICTDVEMPKMDGLHFVTKIREEPLLKKLPVIVFSSLVAQESKRKWDSIGVDKFMSKAEMNHLVEHIDKLIFKR